MSEQLVMEKFQLNSIRTTTLQKKLTNQLIFSSSIRIAIENTYLHTRSAYEV